ncbi:MAG: hypothetical protein RR341_07685, partial [Bacteroidales bacterium]
MDPIINSAFAFLLVLVINPIVISCASVVVKNKSDKILGLLLNDSVAKILGFVVKSALLGKPLPLITTKSQSI